MDAGVTSFRSILEKPLTQLTEEDISQLTREDCRKYLKEKGMRRPSWNKSQAIQQVISLKALLETSEDSGASALRKIFDSKPPATPNSADSVKDQSFDADNGVCVSVDEAVPSRQNDSPKSTPPGRLDCQPEEADKKAIPSRNLDATNGSGGQMTIFYCGKVNVYDGVPPEKAQEIMHLAASPIQLPLDDPIGGTSARLFPCHSQSLNDKQGLLPPIATISHIMQPEKMSEYPQQCKEKGNITHDPDVEGQTNRQVSLQRYLEKRKDRLKPRRILGPTLSSTEVFTNHHLRTHTSNGQPTGSGTSSPPQPGVPHSLCNSAENHLKIANFPVDLNEDIQER